MKRKMALVLLTTLTVMSFSACTSTTQSSNQSETSGTDTIDPISQEVTTDKYVITAAATPSDASPEGAYALAFKEYVEEKSEGRIEVQLYMSAQMGTDRDILESVQFGNLTMGGTGLTQWTNFITELNILDGPFVMTDEDIVHALFEDDEFNKVLSSGFEAKGYHYLGEHFLGFRMMTSNVPIYALQDFKGIKIRVIENPTPIALWSALGSNPTPLAFTEVYTALQQGTVDAQENPITNIYDKKFYEQQDYIILTNHQIHADFWAMNLDFYNDLPDDLKTIVDDASIVGIAAAHKYAAEEFSVQLEAMEEYGCEVITPEASLLEDMVNTTEQVRKDINASYPEFYEELEAALERIQ